MENINDTKSEINYLKYEIFKDNIFSEEGLFKYLRSVNNFEYIKKDIKYILNKYNSNIDNLDLIRESRIIQESKQNYNTLNSIFFSIVLSCYPFVLDKVSEDVNNLDYIKLFGICFLVISIYLIILYFQIKKPDEKRALAYFWLETEIDKRIKDFKDSEE